MEHYQELLDSTKHLIKTQSSVICPALNKEVIFNQKGYRHILYKKGRHLRDKESQIMRLKLFPYAIQLIKLTTTIQEHFIELDNITQKETEYWGFIAILDAHKVKVIVKRQGNGIPHFWSIIPAWVTNLKRDGRYISMMKGDPKID